MVTYEKSFEIIDFVDVQDDCISVPESEMKDILLSLEGVAYYCILKCEKEISSNNLLGLSAIHCSEKAVCRIKDFYSDGAILPLWMKDFFDLKISDNILIRSIMINRGKRITISIHKELLDAYSRLDMDISEGLAKILGPFKCISRGLVVRDINIKELCPNIELDKIKIEVQKIYDEKDIERNYISSIDVDLDLELDVYVDSVVEELNEEPTKIIFDSSRCNEETPSPKEAAINKETPSPKEAAINKETPSPEEARAARLKRFS